MRGLFKLNESIVRYITEKLNAYLIILFGSTAKGLTHPSSDVDIAFLSDNQYSDYELFLLKEELASILNKDVDFIDLKKASTVFQAQIITTGKILHCTDHQKRMAFEMLTLKLYAKLNEERKVIIDTITESGSVYHEK